MEVEGTPWRSGPGQTVCRCCLAEGCYKDISTEYFWMGKREVYSEMLIETFDVNIGFATNSGPNSNSRLICEPCIARLRDASEFKRQVQDCEKMFMQQLEPGSSSSVLELDGTQSGKAVKMEVVKIEKVDSDDDDFDRGGDDSDDDLDDEPLTKFATKVPKKESMDILELLDDPKPTKRKVSVKVKTPPVKKVKVKVPTKTTPKASSSKTATKAVVVKADKKKKDVRVNYGARWNAEIILKFTTAYPFRYTGSALLCVLCATEFQDPSAFRAHMKDEHQTINVRVALHHVNSENFLKLDCTELSCRICSLPFEKLADLARHLKEDHRAKLDLERQLELLPYVMDADKICCGICDSKQAGIRQLGRHLSTHFQRFTCENCGKAYINMTSMKQHSRLCQKEKLHYCQKCHAPFKTIEEKRVHTLNSRKCWVYRCEVCGERFMVWKSKQEHLVQVHGKPTKTYTCTECGEKFDSTHTYRKHFRLTHGEGFVCPYCGRTWESKTLLDRHLVVHTKEKPFTCEHCSKGFGTKKDLVQHSWIHSEHKRFSCEICDKKFNQRVSWKGHMKHHHPGLVDF